MFKSVWIQKLINSFIDFFSFVKKKKLLVFVPLCQLLIFWSLLYKMKRQDHILVHHNVYRKSSAAPGNISQMLEVEFVPFEFGYFLVCKSFAKSSLIRWSSSGLVKTSMAVIARAFPWDKVKGWAAGSPVKRCYDWLKRTTKWLALKESSITRFIRSQNRYKSIKDVGVFLVLLVHEIISLIMVTGFAKKKNNIVLKKKKKQHTNLTLNKDTNFHRNEKYM